MKSDEALAAEQGLEAKLAEAGADQVRRGPSFDAAPETGTPAETVQDEQPRNELGQFAAVDEPETNEVAPESTEEEAQGQDPAVAAFLAKYGGDPEKALQAAVHAQRKLGQQSTEVGQLRAENEQYQALINELQGLRSDMSHARQQQPLDQGTIDWFDQQAYENPYGMAEQARKQGNDLLFQRALNAYKEVDPGNYAVYLNELRNAELRAEMQKTQQLPSDATVNIALTNVRARNPHFVNYDDAFAEATQNYPAVTNAFEAAVQAGDTAKAEQAIETLYALAQGDTLKKMALTGPSPTDTLTTSDVVAPAVSEPHEPAPEPTPVDEFRAAFKQQADARRRGVFVAE